MPICRALKRKCIQCTVRYLALSYLKFNTSGTHVLSCSVTYLVTLRMVLATSMVDVRIPIEPLERYCERAFQKLRHVVFETPV